MVTSQSPALALWFLYRLTYLVGSLLENFLGPLAAFCSSFTWAISVSAYSQLSHRYPGSAVNYTRAVVGLPLAIMYALFVHGGFGPVTDALLATKAREIGWFTIAMFSGYAFGDVLFLQATRAIGVPAALAISSCYPFWSAIAGFLFLGEALTLTKGTGLICTVAGTVLVILAGKKVETASASEGNGISHSKGVLLAVATSLFWALNAYATTVGGRELSVSIATVLRLTIGLILCPLVGLVMLRRMIRPVAFVDLRRVLIFFMIEGFGGATLYLYGLSHSPVAIGAALTALSPAMSAPIAWLAGQEKFSILKTVGIVIALVGVVLLVIP